MNQIEFLAGNEKRFLEFTSRIDTKDKVALVSHTDLDGIGAATIIGKSVDLAALRFVEYEHLTPALIDSLVAEKITFLIISDLAVEPDFVRYAEKFFLVLIIDHHRFSEDFNSEQTFFINAEGYCATYLSYVLFSSLHDYSSYEWLVACACISDWMYLKNISFMRRVAEHYGSEFPTTETHLRTEDLQKVGVLWNAQETLSLALIYHGEALRSVYDSLPSRLEDVVPLFTQFADPVRKEIEECYHRFEEEKKSFRDGFYWSFEPRFKIAALVSNELSQRHWDKTLLIMRRQPPLLLFSARRQDGKQNVAGLLQTLTQGLKDTSAGGHFKAAGGFVQLSDQKILLERIENLS